ncbi:MAG: hypothetical protein VXX11_06355 [Planctomycetota bacterium]|nr:hypothetical protein [Planctomycetota bacterium]
MASPLRAFRKYQKQMLVFFGVLLMIAFILGGVLTSMPNSNSGTREPQDSISVQWDGASYSQDELQSFLRLHILSQRFLAQLAQTALAANATPETDPSLLPVSSDQDSGIRDVANILLQADEARRLGVTVNDVVVDNFLRRVGGDNGFTEGDYMVLLKESTSGQLSLARLKEHLKVELAALRLQDIMFSGMGSPSGQVNQVRMAGPPVPFVTPIAAVSSQERTTNKVTIEFVKIEVEPFLEQVEESPNNAEVRKLYEQGAVQFPSFQKNTPGFRVPDKAVIQWFKTDQDSFLPDVESITEERIVEEYNRRVEAKDLSVIDSGSDEETTPPAETEGDGESPEGETEPAEGGTEPAEGDAKPADASPNQDTGDTQEDAPPEKEETSGLNEQSSLPRSSSNQFVSTRLIQDETEKQNETPQDDEQVEAEGVQEEEEGDPPAENQEGEASPSETEDAAGTESQEETESQPSDETSGEAEEVETKFKTLEDVRVDIIEDLRRQDAGEKRNSALESITETLNEYFIEYEIWQAEQIEESGSPAPAAPDFAKIAADYGVKFSETDGTVDFPTFNETELGQSFSEIPRSQFNFQNFPTVAQTLFQNFRSTKQYQAKTTLLRDYIYWISEKENQHVPTLEEAREDIKEYWKWDKAVDLARAEAKSKLEESDFSETAFKSQPFSWLSVGAGSLGAGGGQLSLSTVNYLDGEELKELDTLGNEFMRTVFGLEIEGEGQPIDALRENVFAVRVVDKVTDNSLAEMTVKNATAPSPDDRRVIGTAMGEYRDDWVADLLKRRNVRWKVKKF